LNKKIICILITIFMAVSLTAPAIAEAQNFELKRVIVGFKDYQNQGYIRSNGWKINHEYHSIPAVACSLPTIIIDVLKKLPFIAYVEDDQVVALDVSPAELTASWGVKQIGADKVWTATPNNKGTGVKVAVIDTGINYGNLDLTPNYIPPGYNAITNGATPPLDDNGHGTHCAGIIAATDDAAGVVGVAPRASLYAVKVLDKSGRGYISDIIEGIQWAIDSKMQVISMSLGSSLPDSTLESACNIAFQNGIVVVAAAGNNGAAFTGSNIIYPARYQNVIAVGATDKNNLRASFSCTGTELDLVAPGVNILSDWLYVSGDGQFRDTWTLSGTSMACPHVAGTAALIIASGEAGEKAWNTYYGTTYTNGDGIWKPSEITNALTATATDLGTAGKDNYYGYGLVNAFKAAVPPTSSPPPQPTQTTYPPTTVATTTGTITGTASNLATNDASYLTIKSASAGSRTQATDWNTQTSIAPVATSKVISLTITYDGKYSTNSVNQKLYIRDYSAQTLTWTQIDSRTVSTSDTTITWSTQTPAKYISATGDVSLRVYATKNTNSQFTCSADYAAFTIKYNP